MTAPETTLPVPAAPPATDEEETAMTTGVITEDLPLTVEVPPIALREGEKIVRHPESGDDVEWTFTGLTVDEDGQQVINYRTPDGVTDSFPVPDPGIRVRVEVGQVYR